MNIPILVFLLGLIFSSFSFADDGAPSPQSFLSPVTEGFLNFKTGLMNNADKEKPTYLVFVAQTDGLPSIGNTDKSKVQYVKISVATFFKHDEASNQNTFSFLDMRVTPITRTRYETVLLGEVKYSRRILPVYTRYKKSEGGNAASVEIYPIGFSYTSEVDADPDMKAIKKFSDDEMKKFADETYDVLSDDGAKEEAMKQIPKSPYRKYAELSADLLGVRAMRVHAGGGEHELLGLQFGRVQAELGLSAETSGCTRIRFGVGAIMSMGLLARVKNFTSFDFKEPSNYGDLEGYGKIELQTKWPKHNSVMRKLAIQQLSLSLQAGFESRSDLEKLFGFESKTSALQGTGGDGAGGGNGGGGSDLGAIVGGGYAESHPYAGLMLGLTW